MTTTQPPALLALPAARSVKASPVLWGPPGGAWSNPVRARTVYEPLPLEHQAKAGFLEARG